MTDYFSILPHLNATLNASSFVLLSSGYYLIGRKNGPAHLNCQLAALTASVLFLISYIVYHAHHGVTKFAGQGIVRPVYFTILFTHTFLAVVIVPFVIVTVRRAKRKDFQRHKAIAPWTPPVWQYRFLPGRICYVMLDYLSPS